jgi:transposase
VPPPSRSCCAPVSSRRRGSRRRRSASCGPCWVTRRSWPGCAPCCATGSTPSWPATATPGRPGCWSGAGRRWLASLELPPVSREVIDDGLALTDALQQPIGRLDAEVRQRAKTGPRVKVLTQLPGAGMFTALVLLAETGDITRSGSARKLASRAGLTPAVRGSDRTVHHGHISKQGPAWVRWVLCEAAQTATRHPDFAPGYEALARRRGKKIATTAVARKLITRAYHLLPDASATGEPR